MESKWPWNVKPRVTPLYYKCTSCIMEKIRKPHGYLSLCVESLVCVCLFFSYTMCVLNMVFNMVSERAIADPAPNWVSHLCLWPVHICKNSWHFCSTQSFCSSDFADIFPHSESGFGEGATFRNWQHSGIGFEERQHYPSEGFHSNFSLQFLLIKICNLKSFWILFILGFWRRFWIFTAIISRKILLYIWKEKNSAAILKNLSLLSALYCFN